MEEKCSINHDFDFWSNRPSLKSWLSNKRNTTEWLSVTMAVMQPTQTGTMAEIKKTWSTQSGCQKRWKKSFSDTEIEVLVG